MPNSFVTALLGATLGIGSVIAGSASAAPTASGTSDSDAECRDNLGKALGRLTTCSSARATCKTRLKKCKEDLAYYPLLGELMRRDAKAGGLTHHELLKDYPSLADFMRDNPKSGGLIHRELLDVVTRQAQYFTVTEAVSFEQAMIEEFARRAPTAEPKALDEMTTALKKVETQVVKTETLLKAAAAVE